jgi:GntR family transcriptional regulator
MLCHSTLEHALTSARLPAPGMVRCMPERDGHIPPWIQVRDALRERIVSGELAPGAMVPSIVTIHQEYGIAKTTARKVLAALRDEGLIVTTPGWGSFVAGR